MRPTLASVGIYPQAEFGSQKEQIGINCVFFYHVRVAVDPTLLDRQCGPGFAIVRSLIEVWLRISKDVAIKSCVRRALVEAPRLNRGNQGKLGKLRHIAHDIRPRFRASASDLEIAVIGPHPDDLAILR